MSTSLNVVSIAAVLLRFDEPASDRGAPLRHADALFGAIACGGARVSRATGGAGFGAGGSTAERSPRRAAAEARPRAAMLDVPDA